MGKLNVTEAAEAAGLSRTTLYAHMKKGKVSYEVDEEGNKLFDESELARAYGPLRPLNTSKSEQPDTAERNENGVDVQKSALLQQQIEFLNQQLETERERRREAEQREREAKAEREKLVSIIERQTYLLAAPKPEPEQPSNTAEEPALKRRGFLGLFTGK